VDIEVKVPLRLWPGAIAYLIVAAVTIACIWIPVTFGAYSWAIFAFVPILAGFASGLTTIWVNRKAEFGFQHALKSTLLGFGLLAAGIIIFAIEGFICVIMAAPLTIVMNSLGLALAHGVDALFQRSKKLYAAPLFLLPFGAIALDYMAPGHFDDIVQTEVVIQATPEAIWPYLNNLDLPPPRETLFRMGVAHPVSIRTTGLQNRSCVLSTGNMPEVIEVRDINRRLRFRVLKTPPTMKEMSPYDLDPSHLEGYFECVWGEFELIPAPGGRTRLIGRSAYRCRFGPADYWKLWTRKVVRDTHSRVMLEIKRRAEASSIPTNR